MKLHVFSTCKIRTITLFVLIVKGKMLSLCFSRAPRHEGVLGELRYSSTHSLTSAVDGGEWSTSRPGRFTPRERAPGTHWVGGWVGPRAVLDVVVKRKILAPPPRIEPYNPDRPARSRALYRLIENEISCAPFARKVFPTRELYRVRIITARWAQSLYQTFSAVYKDESTLFTWNGLPTRPYTTESEHFHV
jgi:hypothetical protein